eukprot:CAMPEP_0117492112 /NCGR_PEP_ID=MMETSP0784-20121206/18414_1 /TAXON_ID=39447 /ORGANISM="" /LENGTH=285 /DNA_ID=CAMNT_0005286923 /DNA_START=106 /DNA_END=960 /DNA_ORIENTATION=-
MAAVWFRHQAQTGCGHARRHQFGRAQHDFRRTALSVALATYLVCCVSGPAFSNIAEHVRCPSPPSPQATRSNIAPVEKANQVVLGEELPGRNMDAVRPAIARREIISLAGLASAAAAMSPAWGDEKTDVVDVINIFGRLAGTSCFGSQAAPGVSCQVTMAELDQKLFQKTQELSEAEFVDALASMAFAWPLKPNGASVKQTVTANKFAEPTSLTNAAIKRGLPPASQAKTAEGVSAALSQEAVPASAAKTMFARIVASTGSTDGKLNRDGVAAWLKRYPGQALDW